MNAFGKGAGSGPGLRPIRSEDDLEAALNEPLAVLYKHSPLCGLSAVAAREVRSFLEGSPGTPVYLVDVIRERRLARGLGERLGIRHESPQAIVLRDGVAIWSASHRGVTALALRSAMA
ncbi:MAG TPA: bacillithiol system redox-active protein YtxJ [Longimicrobiales bacterium]|nr:bacillithiol system redox-active protein YtxJ [Longimicrobiales bacterium]